MQVQAAHLIARLIVGIVGVLSFDPFDAFDGLFHCLSTPLAGGCAGRP